MLTMKPRVCICVPNLNTLPFLRERFDSIFAQTFSDWELFVYDSFSDDGSWEYIKELARREKRIRVIQGPREGPYAAWNECVRQTTADYLYIATSDDSMAPDCIEKLLTALEKNDDCGLAHCPLIITDQNSNPVAHPKWPECTMFGQGIGNMITHPHLRRAPYDGLLHLTGHHVYLSITQLLIRRSLFRQIGDFSNCWGSISDFHWEMKAGLSTNTIHVPDTWATWRLHSKGVTATVNRSSRDHARKYDDMIKNAVQACTGHLNPVVRSGLHSYWLDWTQEMRMYYAELNCRERTLDRRLYQIRQVLEGSPAIRSEFLGRLFGRPHWYEYVPVRIRDWLQSIGITPIISA
jgi:glycosyltransferase involved in cell wall biosynthesis